jgi:threonine 3-dehydrogenase
MKALAKLSAAPGLTLCEVDRPVAGHNDVLIEIKPAACGPSTNPHPSKVDSTKTPAHSPCKA